MRDWYHARGQWRQWPVDGDHACVPGPVVLRHQETVRPTVHLPKPVSPRRERDRITCPQHSRSRLVFAFVRLWFAGIVLLSIDQAQRVGLSAVFTLVVAAPGSTELSDRTA